MLFAPGSRVLPQDGREPQRIDHTVLWRQGSFGGHVFWVWGKFNRYGSVFPSPQDRIPFREKALQKHILPLTGKNIWYQTIASV